MVRWGVLGTASIAIRAVIPALQRSRNGLVVAVASRTRERAQQIADQLGIARAYGAYDLLLADSEIDAVYIPLPNTLHHFWTLQAAAAGKHVLCEKPLAPTAGACAEMVATCRSHGVVLMEAFMYRCHPRTRRVAELVTAGAVGTVRLVRAAFTFRVRQPERNIRMRADLAGGALYDVGCYGVNVARMLLGEPDEVMAMATVGPSGVDEVTGAVLRWQGGVLGVLDCALVTERREEVEVVGTDGTLVVPRAFLPGVEDAEIHLLRGGQRTVERVQGVDQYQEMVEQFADAVLGRSPVPLPPEDAVGNASVLEALHQSRRLGCSQRLASGGTDHLAPRPPDVL